MVQVWSNLCRIFPCRGLGEPCNGDLIKLLLLLGDGVCFASASDWFSSSSLIDGNTIDGPISDSACTHIQKNSDINTNNAWAKKQSEYYVLMMMLVFEFVQKKWLFVLELAGRKTHNLKFLNIFAIFTKKKKLQHFDVEPLISHEGKLLLAYLKIKDVTSVCIQQGNTTNSFVKICHVRQKNWNNALFDRICSFYWICRMSL